MAITGHKSEKFFRAYITMELSEHATLLAEKWRNDESDEKRPD